MDEVRRIRNLGYLPFIEDEGEFLKEMPVPPGLCEEKIWHEGLSPSDRMFFHQTLNSARRFARFKRYPFVLHRIGSSFRFN